MFPIAIMHSPVRWFYELQDGVSLQTIYLVMINSMEAFLGGGQSIIPFPWCLHNICGGIPSGVLGMDYRSLFEAAL
jgi:hypothetical protein